MSEDSPLNELFQKLARSEEARDALIVASVDVMEQQTVRATLDYGDVDMTVLMSPRAASEFADDLESQAKQEEWRDEAEPVLTKIRDTAYEAGVA